MLHDSPPLARRLKVIALVACCGAAAPWASARQDETPTIRVTPRALAQPANADNGVQDAAAADDAALPPADPASDTVSFAAFSEPVELTTLVDYVGSTLGINIVIKGTLTGSVMFNAPVEVPKRDLLDLLDALLEQYDASITQDASGIYTVQARAETPINFSTERATSKVIDTAGLRPSGLTDALNAVLPRPAGGGAPTATTIAYIDELGVIVMTGTSRDIRRVETLIAELRDRYLQAHFTRIELAHIAAPVARERVIQLAGSGTGQTTRVTPQQPQGRAQQQQQQQQQAGTSGGALDNIADRLTVDAQDNALIFRGNDTELAQVIDVIRVIDVPNRMERRQYFAGTAVRQIADLAKQRALGEVIVLTDPTTDLSNQFRVQFPQQQGQQAQQTTTAVGGPVMIVDERRQSIIYYGTIAQQAELADWIKLLDVGEDAITLEYYKLANAQAVAVAEIIQGLISGQSLTGTSPLLPGAQQGFQQNFAQTQLPRAVGDDAGFAPDPTRVFVIADEANNQVIVKAPKKQQDEFRKLVGRLDLRRPQVYIEATIVSVSDTKDFRLAFESQLTAGQFQAQTNFGLTSPGATFQDPRTVAPNLAGFTSALIRSDSVPFVINAIQTNTDSRILSSPQLLVNDNEQAEIIAIDQQPTTTTSQGNNTTITSFGGYEDAGTTLTVTPTISEAGYIRLDYAVTLSSFTASSAGDGIPPPKADNSVSGIATIPTDATIVVGGITVKNNRNTIIKIPLLGDIPLIGHLFRDTNKDSANSVLYIFITPRIMTDPTFADLRLLSRGPQAEVKFDVDLPPLQPRRIERSTPPAALPAIRNDDEDDA